MSRVGLTGSLVDVIQRLHPWKPVGILTSLKGNGPPLITCAEDIMLAREPGESKQEYQCRNVREMYQTVQGTTFDDNIMVDFYKQALVAYRRGVST